MTRSPLLLAPAAALVAGAIALGVTGTPDTAGAASPFQVSKSQFTHVQKVAVQAMKRANANAKDLKALKQVGTAGSEGVQGPPGPAGGFDTSKLSRVAGTGVTIDNTDAYISTTVSCPAGSVALSGAWYVETAVNHKAFHVARSYPNAGMTSWSFRFAYTGAGEHAVTPYVICAAP